MIGRVLQPHARRQGQRGQILVTVALMAVVIFGAVALGVDLSHQTATKRSLQNISDAAALAAARDVYVPATGSLPVASQQQAAIDAAKAVALNQSPAWPLTWISSPPANTCPGVGYCFTGAYQGTTVTFSTPPANAANPADVDTAHVEVDLANPVSNGFAILMGQPTSVIRSKSIGFHTNVNTKFGYALYSSTDVQTGNSPEIIYGNVYIGTIYNPQSNGQTDYTCAEPASPAVPGEAGYVVFGAPQPTPPAVNYGSCSTVKGSISSSAPAGVCPVGASWVPAPAGGAFGICLANPPIQPPSFNPPTVTGILPSCLITSQPDVNGGVYHITSSQCPPVLGGGLKANLRIEFSSSFTSLSCTSFLIDSNVTVSIYLYKQNLNAAFMSSYGAPSCNGSGIDGDQAAFYQTASPAPPNQPVLSVSGDGCCPPVTITGSVVLPAGAVSLSTNSALTVVGQAQVSEWADQSGDHPNAVVSYSGSGSDNLPEQLRLVE
jgi:Flp pilus assembly protein TadG